MTADIGRLLGADPEAALARVGGKVVGLWSGVWHGITLAEDAWRKAADADQGRQNTWDAPGWVRALLPHLHHLAGAEARVALALLACADSTGTVSIGAAAVGKLASQSVRSKRVAQRALRRLESLGLVRRLNPGARGRGNRAAWKLTIPERTPMESHSAP
jgi:predicted transcriptional regulator